MEFKQKSFLAKIAAWLGIAIFAVCMTCYAEEARLRSKVHQWDTMVSTGDHGKYTAKYAYISREGVILRIYSTSDMQLLAERTFDYPDQIKLHWSRDSVLYHTNDLSLIHDGTINLPPSLMDNLLARLP